MYDDRKMYQWDNENALEYAEKTVYNYFNESDEVLFGCHLVSFFAVVPLAMAATADSFRSTIPFLFNHPIHLDRL